jgi:hypothetical protein
MRRWAHVGSSRALRPSAALLIVGWLGLAALGCGSSAPREADIFHDPALRPGVVEPEGAEREMLARLGSIADETPVQAAGGTVVVEAPYAAASGRRCRGLRGAARRRVACETDDGEWVLVPEVSGAEVAPSAGASPGATP